MNSKQIWTAIIGAGVVASLTTAVGFFPELNYILAAGAGLVTAIVSFVTKKQEAK